MEKLKEQIKKELKEIEEKGINASNLELISKLADIYKDLEEIGKMEKGGQEMSEYNGYREGGYGYGTGRGGYNEGGYGARGGRGGYSAGQGGYNEGGYGDGGYGRRGSGGRYSRMRDHMDRMMDGMEQYEYGKERYMHGGDESRVMEGLEKLMYGVCMMVESAMDFAETPQEKELIRKHVQKISHL